MLIFIINLEFADGIIFVVFKVDGSVEVTFKDYYYYGTVVCVETGVRRFDFNEESFTIFYVAEFNGYVFDDLRVDYG